MINLSELRREAGLSQEELADFCGVSRVTITMIEGGHRLPSVPLAQRIGQVLGFDWTRLYKDYTKEN